MLIIYISIVSWIVANVLAFLHDIRKNVEQLRDSNPPQYGSNLPDYDTFNELKKEKDKLKQGCITQLQYENYLLKFNADYQERVKCFDSNT